MKPIFTRIAEAMDRGDLAEFERLLRAHPQYLRSEDGTDNWMWYVARKGMLPFVKCLVDLGLDVNVPDSLEFPNRPITGAASQGHIDVVRWLLDHGARPESPALIRAARDGHLDIVKLLVERGADIHADISGLNALMHADGHPHVVAYLRSKGAKTLLETTPPDFPARHKRLIEIFTKDLDRGKLGKWKCEVAGDPPVMIYATEPSRKSKVRTVFTVGMSDREGIADEVSLMLPPDWPLDEKSLADPVRNWPIEWLKRVVRDVIRAGRWPKAKAAVYMNGNPPAPLAPNTELCGWICLPQQSNYQMPDHRWIGIALMFPIYREEKELVDASDAQALARRFEAANIPLHIDPDRPNVAIKQPRPKGGRSKKRE